MRDKATACALGTVVWMALACLGGSDDPVGSEVEPATEAPAPVAVETPDESVRYVWASSLNLREGVDPESAVVQKIEINTRVKVLEEAGDRTRVALDDGTEGWTGTPFLGTELLTTELCAARAAEAADAEEHLSWRQRGAALAPEDPSALQALAEGYRRLGRDDEAIEVERRFGWPHSIYVPQRVAEDAIDVEWAVVFDRTGVDAGVALTTEAAAGYGLATTDRWWVLPKTGKVLEARVSSITWEMLNECGGEYGVVVHLESSDPTAGTLVAATRTRPPASWSTAPAPEAEGSWEEAHDAFLAEAERRAGDLELRDMDLVWDGKRWFGHVSWALPREPREGDTDWTWEMEAPCKVLIADIEGGTVHNARESDGYCAAEGTPRVARDLDGDGTVETVWETGCATVLYAADRTRIKQTVDRCCGD